MDINTTGSSGRTHVRQDSQPAQHKRKKKNHYRAMSRKLLVLICLSIVGLGAVLILRLHYTHTPLSLIHISAFPRLSPRRNM